MVIYEYYLKSKCNNEKFKLIMEHINFNNFAKINGFSHIFSGFHIIKTTLCSDIYIFYVCRVLQIPVDIGWYFELKWITNIMYVLISNWNVFK